MEKVSNRDPGTICPSEVARSVGTAEGWRDLMPDVRAAAQRLVEEGRVEITQGGEVVRLDESTGPIRIRKTRSAPAG
jgi:hypothetical protein